MTSSSAATNEAYDKGHYGADWSENKRASHCCLDRAIVRIGRKLADKKIARNRDDQIADYGEERGNSEAFHRRDWFGRQPPIAFTLAASVVQIHE